MTILETISSLQGPAVLLLVVIGPSILPRILGYIRNRKNPPINPIPPRPPLPILAKAILGLHTLYRLYTLFFPPYNIFTAHNLSIHTSPDTLRRHVLPSSPSGSLSRLATSPTLLESLVTKLSQLDNRLLYSRYGHQPLLECTWCTSQTDYLIAALPGILGVYIALAGLIGILGLESVGEEAAKGVKRAWRGSISWILVVMAIGEVGVRYLWELRITDGDTVQLDPLIHTLRSISLLLIPLIYTLLLPLPSPSKAQTIIPILTKTQNTLSTIRLTSLARTSILRDTGLRNRLIQSSIEDDSRGRIGRADEDVRRSAEALGLGSGAGDAGRRWIEEGWSGLVRIGKGP